MASITSRVNGLKITIPNDARGVIHRFAIAGGGNELVFEPVRRKDFEQSALTDEKPVSMGGEDKTGEAAKRDPLPEGLSVNVTDDDAPATSKPKPKKRGRKADDDDVI